MSQSNTLVTMPWELLFPWEWYDFFVFNDISTVAGYFNGKAILVEEQQCYYLTDSREENKGVRAFPKGNSPKMNVIARVGFEPAYYDLSSTLAIAHRHDPLRGEFPAEFMKWPRKITCDFRN